MRMGKLGVLILFVGLVGFPAAAQSGFQVGGGYTFRPVTFNQNVPAIPDVSPAISSSTKLKMNGFYADLGYDFNGFLGVVTDFSLTRNTQPSSSEFEGQNDFYSLLVGPQIYPLGHHKITPFADVEGGLGDFEITSPSSTGCGGSYEVGPCSFTTASFVFAAGGGLDVFLTRQIGLKLPEFDFERSAFFEPGPGNGFSNQSHYVIKAGLIIRLVK